MNTICLASIGDIDPAIMNATRRTIFESFGSEALDFPGVREPACAWDPGRRQLRANIVLNELMRARPHPHAVVCAVTEKDLFLPTVPFVFGGAQLGGNAALISLARLRPEFHGFAPDPTLLIRRLRREVKHELGHAFGLMHCANARCLMSQASSVARVDTRGRDFCQRCLAMLPRHESLPWTAPPLLRTSPQAAFSVALSPI